MHIQSSNYPDCARAIHHHLLDRIASVICGRQINDIAISGCCDPAADPAPYPPLLSRNWGSESIQHRREGKKEAKRERERERERCPSPFNWRHLQFPPGPSATLGSPADGGPAPADDDDDDAGISRFLSYHFTGTKKRRRNQDRRRKETGGGGGGGGGGRIRRRRRRRKFRRCRNMRHFRHLRKRLICNSTVWLLLPAQVRKREKNYNCTFKKGKTRHFLSLSFCFNKRNPTQMKHIPP